LIISKSDEELEDASNMSQLNQIHPMDESTCHPKRLSLA